MSQPRVVHDVHAVAGVAGVILWQEIAIARYTKAVGDIDRVFHHSYLGYECPISYKSDVWEPVAHLHGHLKTHSGRLHVTPSRYVTWQGLQHKDNSINPVVFMNTHMISGAFSNHYPITKKWRRKMWNIHFAAQMKKVIELHDRGYTVIGGGDLNRGSDMPKYSPHQRWLSHGGIDHLWCVEAPHGVKVELKQLYPYHGGIYTDHRPRIAELSLT